MTYQERVNIIILAMRFIGCNDHLTADGVVGDQARAAVAARRKLNFSADQLNLLILAYKAAGWNKNLEADGVSGEQLLKAEEAFLRPV